MAKRPAGRKITLQELTAARRGYESGMTFTELGQRHGLSESGVRRLLRSLGVEPRKRGKTPAAVPTELVAADAREGLSARAIAAKHRLPRGQVDLFLRQRGLARPPQLRVLAPLGSRTTNEQARLRRRPPIRIPIRTAEECRNNRWTALEAGAVHYEIRCGRYQVVPRGQKGLVWAPPLGLVVHWRTLAERRALPRLEAADRLCPVCLCVVDGACGCPAPAERSSALPQAAPPAAQAA